MSDNINTARMIETLGTALSKDGAKILEDHEQRLSALERKGEKPEQPAGSGGKSADTYVAELQSCLGAEKRRADSAVARLAEAEKLLRGVLQSVDGGVAFSAANIRNCLARSGG